MIHDHVTLIDRTIDDPFRRVDGGISTLHMCRNPEAGLRSEQMRDGLSAATVPDTVYPIVGQIHEQSRHSEQI